MSNNTGQPPNFQHGSRPQSYRQFKKIRDSNNGDQLGDREQRHQRVIDELELTNKILNWNRRFHQYLVFISEFKIDYKVYRGEVYEVDFGLGVNSEIHERHYAVIVNDSFDQNDIVVVCPLKTKRHAPNPTSDVSIGRIPEIDTDVDTIAVFNQIRGIDKLRIYRRGLIQGKLADHPGPVTNLNEMQMNKIIDAFKATIVEGNPIYYGQ